MCSQTIDQTILPITDDNIILVYCLTTHYITDLLHDYMTSGRK